MSIDLLEISQKTDELVASIEKRKGPIVPPISEHYMRYMKAMERIGVTTQRDRLTLEARVDQARRMGFHQMSTQEAAEALLGRPSKKTSMTSKGIFRGNDHHYEYVFDHHHATSLGHHRTPGEISIWCPQVFTAGKVPFLKKRCIAGCLNYLKAPIPLGITMRIFELRALNLFNAFCVVAPEDCWMDQKETSDYNDPIVLAEQWELPRDIRGDITSHGKCTAFFVARWDPKEQG